MGQGDNQVLLLTHVTGKNQADYVKSYPDIIKDQLINCLKSLRLICSGTGMDLKLEETWCSTEVFNYGKEVLIGGCFMPTSLKKICRAFDVTSHTYPSLSNRISSLMTSSFAATTKGYDACSPYLLALLECLNLLDKEVTFSPTLETKICEYMKSQSLILTEELQLFVLILPKAFGGYPVTSFLEFLYRGRPDNLTSQLLWLKSLKPLGDLVLRTMEYIGHAVDMNDDIDYAMLILDPQSINWKNPMTTSNVIKSALISNIKTIVRNKDIKMLFNLCTDKTHKAIIDYLMSINPCFPRALNEIYRLSPDGAQKSFLSTFTDVRTLKGMMPSELSHQLLNGLQLSEIQAFVNVLRIFLLLKSDSHIHPSIKYRPYDRFRLIKKKF